MTTHASAELLRAYAEADPALEENAAWALEGHLEGCTHCQAALASVTATTPWAGFLDETRHQLLEKARGGPAPVRPRPGWRRVVRAVGWEGWSMPTWTGLSVVLAGLALWLDHSYPARPSVVLLFAPVAPLGALAVAWSRHTDPGWEVLAGTARAGFELLLRRAFGVTAVVMVPLTVGGLLLGRQPALWLLPSLTFTSATLWLGSRIGVSRAAALFGVVWALLVVVPGLMEMSTPVLLRSGSVAGWAVAAVLTSVPAGLRMRSFRRMSTWL